MFISFILCKISLLLLKYNTRHDKHSRTVFKTKVFKQLNFLFLNPIFRTCTLSQSIATLTQSPFLGFCMFSVKLGLHNGENEISVKCISQRHYNASVALIGGAAACPGCHHLGVTPFDDTNRTETEKSDMFYIIENVVSTQEWNKK